MSKLQTVRSPLPHTNSIFRVLDNPGSRICKPLIIASIRMEKGGNHAEESREASLVEPLLPQDHQQHEDPGRLPQAELIGDLTEEENTPMVDEEGGLLSSSFEQQQQVEIPTLTLDESSWEHGEEQPTQCRNLGFAVLFVGQLLVVLTLAMMTFVALVKEENEDDDHDDGDHSNHHHNVVSWTLFGIASLGSVAILSASIILLLLTALADMMIQVSLVMTPISCGLSSLGSLLLGQVGPAALLAVLSIMGVCYAVRVWHRIPFATANLSLAMEAIHAYKGVILLAYASVVQVIMWSLIWAGAIWQVAVVRKEWIFTCAVVDSKGDLACDKLSTQGNWILLALLLSMYWTSQVLRNLLHTTIAGVVGVFWFNGAPAPDASSNTNTCCWRTGDSVIYDAWVRSSLYSFGSICFGSLLTAVMQVIRILVRLGRRRREEQRNGQQSLLWCLLEFTVDQLERLLEYINSWAFVYVALYGYDYLTAGNKVYQLFTARGWSAILNDHLISRSLRMMQLFIGILSGALTLILSLLWFGFGSNSHPLLAFLCGSIMGSFLADVQLQVVTSAVETIFVCFAEAPSALMEHHSPELASRMILAWRSAYPVESGF